MNQDLLTKLLANENLTIIRENVRTASFNIVSRVLRLPVRLNLSDTEEFMMSVHEVGHALYTDSTYIDLLQAEKERKNFNSFMNVLEDVRIERLMKEYYPGVRKDFFSGYKSLNDRDFFGVSKSNINSLSLIDRINLFFKVGYRSGAKFNAEERVFINRAERADTIDDVYELAIDIYEYSLKKKQEKSTYGEPDITGEDEYDFDTEQDEFDDEYDDGDVEDGDKEFDLDSEEESDEESEKEGASTAGGVNAGDDAPEESITQRNFDSAMDMNTEDPDKKINYVIPGVYGLVKETPYKEVIDAINKEIADNNKKMESVPNELDYFYSKFLDTRREDDWNKFRANNAKTVSHLAKEFEIRKAARRYSRTQVSSSGSLNMRKIHNYRTSGDIFAKLESMHDEKDHSFLMLLDWSGSMQDHFADSVGQVITLASFCRRVKIPFRVIGFRDAIVPYDVRHEPHNKADGISGVATIGNVEMFTLLDSSMNSAEFDLVSKFMHTGYLCRVDKFSLTGTPLLQAINWIYNYLPKFQNEIGTEKTSLIIVTDGEATSSEIIDKNGEYVSRFDKSTQNFVRCKYTGKIYNLKPRDASDCMVTYLKMINNAFPNVKRVGFFVSSRTRRSLQSFNYIYNMAVDTTDILNGLRKNKFFEYPTSAYDKLFVIPSTAERMDLDFDSINSKMTPAQISKKMSTAVSNLINSRVVLTKFVETIA